MIFDAVLNISTSQNGAAPEKITVDCTVNENNGKYFIKYCDSNGASNSLILDEGRIHIGRKDNLLGYKMQLIEGKTTKGIFTNEVTFLAVCKRADWQFDGKCGAVRLAYHLPDISDEPADFVVNMSINGIE